MLTLCQSSLRTDTWILSLKVGNTLFIIAALPDVHSVTSLTIVFFCPLIDSEDRDGPWLGMHNTRTGPVSSKSDKPSSKDCSATASALPGLQCTPVDNAWPDNYDPPPKSKGKSVKLKKNSKTENSKKLIRQGSKDSVVLVGYKNLKAPCKEQLKEGDASLSQEQRDALQGDTHSNLRTNANTIFDSCATSGHFGNGADNTTTNTAWQKSDLKNPKNLDVQKHSQAGTGVIATSNRPLHKDDQTEHCGQKLPQWPSGMKQIEVKPSSKDLYQGEKVTVVLPCRSDGALCSNMPETRQTEPCHSQHTVDSVFEKPDKEATQQSQSCLVSVHVTSECLRLPDGGATVASSRLSDSGIESEPSSFATQCVPGPQSGSGGAESGASQLDRPHLSPAPRPVQQSTVQKPSGAGETLNPENTSGVSGVQSSLTSINSLPSDDEGDEGSSRASSGADVRVRKSSVLVQEQNVVFSGDVSVNAAPLTGAAHSQSTMPTCDLEMDSKLINVSELHLEGAAGSGTVKEPRSEPHTACPSSNSATSSTDLVKRGMVENYFGSCSSTDVSEISPVETSAVTLGVQAQPQAEEEDEDDTEHEMIENGYYEEGDGYAFVNGVADEERTGDVDTTAQETSLLYERLGIGYLQETKDLSNAPICSNLASSSVGHSFGRPPCPSTSLPCSLRWYECASTSQMKA